MSLRFLRPDFSTSYIITIRGGQEDASQVNCEEERITMEYCCAFLANISFIQTGP